MSDKQPLLPTTIHSHPSKLRQPKISFPSSSSSFPTDLESGSGSSSTLIDHRNSQYSQNRRKWSMTDRVGGGERQGVPKFSRECFWSEVKCYGSYILPVFLVFGVLVVGASLLGVGIKQGWF